jgi:putative ABC transport system permease protein
MLGYDLKLALRSLRRNIGLSMLMVLAVALGIAVCTITFTVYHAMSTNPIAWKNDRLYAVTIDSWNPEKPYDEKQPEMPPEQLTYRDAIAVHESDIPERSLVMFKSERVLDSQQPGRMPFYTLVRVTHGDFFPMFETPFLHGSGWDRKADAGPEPVIVLSRETNEKAYGGENSVGRTLRLGDNEFRVVGVLDHWEPAPKFYDLNNGSFQEAEDVFIPFLWGETLQLPATGNTNCWKSEQIESFQDFLNSECVWVQMWAELPDRDTRERYQAFLDNYVRGQKAGGRLPRPLNNRLMNVDEWLDFYKVVKKDNRVLIGIALLFLAVCLVNIIGLLLAKFLNGAALTGLRRALGASRKDVIRQHLTEVVLVGLAGGVLGLLFAAAGLAGIRAIYDDDLDRYEQLTRIDPVVVLVTLGLSLLAGLIAGVYPAWRIGRTSPAVYLKTQ